MKTIRRALVLLFVASSCLAQDVARVEEVVLTTFATGPSTRGSDVILSKRYLDAKVTVAVLANLNGPTLSQNPAKLADLAHGGVGQVTQERKEIKLPVATLSKYVGTSSRQASPC